MKQSNLMEKLCVADVFWTGRKYVITAENGYGKKITMEAVYFRYAVIAITHIIYTAKTAVVSYILAMNSISMMTIHRTAPNVMSEGPNIILSMTTATNPTPYSMVRIICISA